MKMTPRTWMTLVIAAMLVGAFSVATAASDVKKEAAYVGDRDTAHSHITGEWLDWFHNPMEGVTMGLDVRIREIYGRNLISMNENQGGKANLNNWHRGRYRTRWSTAIDLATDVTFNTRLCWEWNYWDETLGKEESVDFDEMVWDTFNVTWQNAFDMPLTLVVGRQDIILGNGWLVLDGTPADGSRTIYFDAVRATYNFNEDAKADLIYIQQYDGEDQWLQPINNREYEHVTQKQDEKGFIAYYTDKALVPGATFEGYYMYKQDEPSTWSKINPASSSAGIDDEIHTIGTALSGDIDDNWSYRAELAKQFGKKNLNSLSAWGFNGRAVYALHDERNSSFHFDYEYLSGDDPDTGANEAFDPLWGEWPQYSRGGDLPAYLWAAETALGEVTNLHRFGIGHTFTIAPKWTMQTDYNLMWADENTYGGTGTPTTTMFNSEGSFRGQMLTGYLKYKCCKQLSAHFLCDYFQPGTYYDGNTQDHAVFLRFNLEYTF